MLENTLWNRQLEGLHACTVQLADAEACSGTAQVLENTLWNRQLGVMSEEIVAALVCQIFEGARPRLRAVVHVGVGLCHPCNTLQHDIHLHNSSPQLLKLSSCHTSATLATRLLPCIHWFPARPMLSPPVSSAHTTMRLRLAISQGCHLGAAAGVRSACSRLTVSHTRRHPGSRCPGNGAEVQLLPAHARRRRLPQVRPSSAHRGRAHNTLCLYFTRTRVACAPVIYKLPFPLCYCPPACMPIHSPHGDERPIRV